MSTMVERLLESAEGLLSSSPRGTAARRRAVSTAYYAVFHALSKLCADQVLPDTPRSGSSYARVYRSLDHKPIKEAFSVQGSALRTNPALRRIGESFVNLQKERLLADYMPPVRDLFSLTRGSELVAEARATCAFIEALEAADRRIVAVHLLFKHRP